MAESPDTLSATARLPMATVALDECRKLLRIQSRRADRLEAEVERLREFVAAHDAVEHLIADHTDDRQAYNAAVERFDQAREALRDG